MFKSNGISILFSLSAILVAGSDIWAQTPTLPLTASANGALTLGEDFSLGLRYDGTARSWGTNNVGQLGTAAALTVVQPTPTQLRINSSTLMTGVARISAGSQHGLLITNAATGVLRAWGRNDSGQLGDTTTTNRTGCVAVVTTTGLTNVVAADAGHVHSVALKSDGTVWAWGNNAAGQVGDNSTTNRLSPVRITPAAPVFPQTFQSVAAGHDHSLALRNDGTVWAWGANDSGQLGTGDTTGSLVPVQVSGLPGGLAVTALAAGQGFSVVLLSDGTVRVWGRADQGQLGNDSDVSSTVPVEPVGLGNTITSITAGDTHVLALKGDGTVWGWGSNSQGELGSLVPSLWSVPQPISDLNNVAVIAAGTSRSAACMSDGSILVWGNPSSAALGRTSLDYRSLRVQVRDVKTAAAIYAGGDQAAVVRTNGRAYLFGQNSDGQLGTGDVNPVVAPTRLLAWPAAGYAFGASHALGVSSSGGVIYAAGDNSYGQLGDGTTLPRVNPVTISIPDASVVKVAAGWHHSVALLSDGTVMAWGRNDAGQLGLGSTLTPVPAPVTIAGLTGVIAVGAGQSHSVALKADGTVWAWGANVYGQLGDNTTVAKLIPTQVKGVGGTGLLTGITNISSGANHILAANNVTKRVYAWGRGTYGQVGHSATTNRLTPYLLGTTNLVNVAAGENHSLALGGDGRVLAWGLNDHGQVGNGTTINRTAPVAVTNVAAASASTMIAAGANSSYAIFGNGTLFGWGDSSGHQLGYAPSRLTPIAWRLTNNAADADADGMLNTWETARFNSTAKAGYDDTDGDGLLDIQEHYYGSTPANYPTGTIGADTDADLLNDFADSDRLSPYNGNSYNIVIASGDNQYGSPASTAPDSVVININGASVPVYMLGSDSSMKLASSLAGVAGGDETLSLTANGSGATSFNYQHRASSGAATIRIAAGVDFVYANATAILNSTIDTDGDGLPDQWEAVYLGNLLSSGSDDSNGDGLLNRDAYRFGLNPAGSDPSGQPAEIDIFGYDARSWLNTAKPRAEPAVNFDLDEEGNVKATN